MTQEIVHQDDDGLWYFWEETWAERRGGFDTRKDAEDALSEYCEEEGLSVPESHVIEERKKCIRLIK